MIYTIDNEIKFDSIHNKLSSCSDPSRSVILTTPAGKCLTILLEKAPDIVGQKQLIESVWEVNGMVIAINTLYQNISIIRRGFRTVSGNDYVYIKTVSRLGFQFSDNVNIDRAEDLNNDDLVSFHPPKKTLSLYKRNKLGFYISCSILMFCGVYLGLTTESISSIFQDDYFFSPYQVLTKTSGCTFFYDDNEIGKPKVALNFVEKIISTGIDCKKYPWIYMSTYNASPVFTALLCKKKFNDDSKIECDSLYYRATK